MTIRGWESRYAEILRKFGYSRRKDEESARLLDSAIGGRPCSGSLRRAIRGRPVMVIGAGPSVARSLPILKKYKGIAKIAADSATEFLIKNRIQPEIVVTDLDGDPESLLRASQKAIMVVHAHGDNIERIPMAKNFPRCVGTTQSRPFGGISNFGGFTDGDRAVFLAHHFGAEKIILLGMDFGGRIGRYSRTRRGDRPTKLKKLREAESLLAWLHARNPEIYSTSAIRGARRITPGQLGNIIIT